MKFVNHRNANLRERQIFVLLQKLMKPSLHKVILNVNLLWRHRTSRLQHWVTSGQDLLQLFLDVGSRIPERYCFEKNNTLRREIPSTDSLSGWSFYTLQELKIARKRFFTTNVRPVTNAVQYGHFCVKQKKKWLMAYLLPCSFGYDNSFGSWFWLEIVADRFVVTLTVASLKINNFD